MCTKIDEYEYDEGGKGSGKRMNEMRVDILSKRELIIILTRGYPYKSILQAALSLLSSFLRKFFFVLNAVLTLHSQILASSNFNQNQDLSSWIGEQ